MIRLLTAAVLAILCPGVSLAQTSVADLHYPAQTGDWDCTPTCFCILLQKFYFEKYGVDPGPLSSQFMGDLSYDLGWASAPDHGFGNGVGMEISRTWGSCKANLCPPGAFTVTDAMLNDAIQYRSDEPFLWKSGIGSYDNAVRLLRAGRAGMVFAPIDSYHAKVAIAADSRGSLLCIDPYPVGGLRLGGPPRQYTMGRAQGLLLWRVLEEDDVVMIFGE